MPVASEDVWKILYSVSRYLFPLLAVSLFFLVLFYILSESRKQREKARGLPGTGTVGEMVVLSGGDELDVNTWFPVPREGVLGSVRSCDLVIPCPGVRTKHLDFSWEDGTGLLIRPRTGCEALVNGVPVTCRSRAADIPLTHGSVLQVGTAMLRLHLFAALDNTPASVQPAPGEVPVPAPGYSFVPFPGTPADSMPPQQACPPPELPEDMAPPAALPPPLLPDDMAPPAVLPSRAGTPAAPEKAASDRPRRSDRWKEDLGE